MAVMNTKKIISIAGALIIVLVLVLGLGLGLAVAQHDDDKGPLSNLRFLVVKRLQRQAGPERRGGAASRQEEWGAVLGGMELKTDNDGRTNIDGIPYGPLRVQVLAQGFQTFGEDYQIDKPELEITVKLKRPGGQYSTRTTRRAQRKTTTKTSHRRNHSRQWVGSTTGSVKRLRAQADAVCILGT